MYIIATVKREDSRSCGSETWLSYNHQASPAAACLSLLLGFVALCWHCLSAVRFSQCRPLFTLLQRSSQLPSLALGLSSPRTTEWFRRMDSSAIPLSHSKVAPFSEKTPT